LQEDRKKWIKKTKNKRKEQRTKDKVPELSSNISVTALGTISLNIPIRRQKQAALIKKTWPSYLLSKRNTLQGRRRGSSNKALVSKPYFKPSPPPQERKEKKKHTSNIKTGELKNKHLEKWYHVNIHQKQAGVAVINSR
jgi:hypothetical protein